MRLRLVASKLLVPFHLVSPDAKPDFLPSGWLRGFAHLSRIAGTALAALLIASLPLALPGCTPDQAMDFGSTGEINTPPQDEMSVKIMREFDGQPFQLGNNDREAEVRLADWPVGHHVLIPYWLGVNPFFPFIMRPVVGRLYVISEALLVRQIEGSNYLIRAGSKMLKSDAKFEATHTRYTKAGKMLPTVVRFVGTAIITVPRDWPATGTITEKVPVLREVSLPMRVVKQPPEYAIFEIRDHA
jgi:hypothetical protein